MAAGRGPRLAEPPRVEGTNNGTETLVGTATPRISWRFAETPTGWTQRRVQIEIRDAGELRERTVLEGSDQVLVAWPFTPLRSREQVEIRLRAGDGARWGDWSGTAKVEAALLDPDDWSGRWITAGSGLGGIGAPAPILGTSFVVTEPVARARLYVTALGIADVTINGRPISDDLLVPGWTSYDRLVRFRAYDVTDLLRRGRNDVTAVLGEGWYRGRIASLPAHRGAAYGERLALRAQLEVELPEGVVRIIATDDTWSSGSSRILANDLYDGQITDLRLPAEPALQGDVETIEHRAECRFASAPSVRALERISPIAVDDLGDGRIRLDFGRDIVGWLSIRASGSRGTKVQARHAEVLDGDDLATRPLRTARATDEWILAGTGVETLEPRFTFHGFRYAELMGIATRELVAVEAIVIGSHLERTATFACSDPELEQLHRNVVASAIGNFVDIPTDCPQRDERLGWTGDLQVFAPAATTLFDAGTFLGDWLESLAIDQLPDGTVPAVVPRVFREENALAGWGDAAVVVPWQLYRTYGDSGLLRRQYPSMRAWVERERALAGEVLLWRGGPQFGDWLDPAAPADDPGRARADPDVVATACFARSARLLASAADVLGHSADAREYAELASGIRRAFREAWVDADGRIESDCQTVYAMAIAWDLLGDPGLVERAGARLAALVRSDDHRIGTGFLGTPLVLGALTSTDHLDDAYRMLLNPDAPGWLFPVRMGATTIWERWDSLLPDGSVNPGEMTSFNHYALGAVASWLHSTIGGLEVLEPGGRRVRVRPRPGGGITSGGFHWDSPYGAIDTSWRVESDGVRISVQVPSGVTAEVIDPVSGAVTQVTKDGPSTD